MMSDSEQLSLREKIGRLVEDKRFSNSIIGVILLNAAILGLQTSKSLSPGTLDFLDFVDNLCLWIFIVEISLKLFAFRLRFFLDGWNVFDFIVVAIAVGPSEGGLSILRAFRIFRVMRLINAVHSMRRVVTGMILAIPGVTSVGGLLLILFYIGAGDDHQFLMDRISPNGLET